MTEQLPYASRWQAAASFAAREHEHQVRKDGRTPYVAHPVRVAMVVALRFGVTDEATLSAALLHDVIEDTGTDYDDLDERFGPDVADIVACLTKDMRLVEAEREAAYDAQLAAGPVAARLIKLADVYDNLSDARDAAAQRKLLGKVRRALDLAAGDDELATARQVVAVLAEAVEADLAASDP
jgi:guanosine-3',5'-bis(diphosphate) 3'-pyrophosphohydrolase